MAPRFAESLRFIAIFFASVSYADTTSCHGRCGEWINSQSTCRCDASCVEAASCCRDYAVVCGTQKGPANKLCTSGGYRLTTEFRNIGGMWRKYQVYVPAVLTPGRQLPLWLLLGGTGDTAELFLDYTGLQSFAQQHEFAFVAFQAHGNGQAITFNVQSGTHPDPAGVNDLLFVQTVLTEMLALPCVDQRHVHCAGYSNGGRFCVLLASEMSDSIASIATIASLRYPKPNHAQRAIPVLAFHGTADRVNPWGGHGNPSYWHESVLDAFHRWGDFNGCRLTSDVPSDVPWMPFSSKIFGTQLREGCKDQADVFLIKVVGGGHTWPGCAWDKPKSFLGTCNKEVSANQLILDFFREHPLPEHQPATRVVVGAAEAEARTSTSLALRTSVAPTLSTLPETPMEGSRPTNSPSVVISSPSFLPAITSRTTSTTSVLIAVLGAEKPTSRDNNNNDNNNYKTTSWLIPSCLGFGLCLLLCTLGWSCSTSSRERSEHPRNPCSSREIKVAVQPLGSDEEPLTRNVVKKLWQLEVEQSNRDEAAERKASQPLLFDDESSTRNVEGGLPPKLEAELIELRAGKEAAERRKAIRKAQEGAAAAAKKAKEEAAAAAKKAKEEVLLEEVAKDEGSEEVDGNATSSQKQKIEIKIVSATGLEPSESEAYCFCEVVGRRKSFFKTRSLSRHGGTLTWHQKGRLHVFPG
ncbi:unnamed protein product, partial [Polarella glacialis]